MASASMALHWAKHCTPEARRIVLDIFRKRQELSGLTTHQVFEFATKEYDVHIPAPPVKVYGPGFERRRGTTGKIRIPVPEPPCRDHPIRSIKYLKQVVLPDMAAWKQVEKFHVMRPPQGLEIVALKMSVAELEQQLARAKGKTAKKIRADKVLEWKWRLAEKGEDPSFDGKIEREAAQRVEDEFRWAGGLQKPVRV